ncbi:MAG: NUMOD3 domain-containing DNA-binding protein [Nanoarchaeota archaeon]
MKNKKHTEESKKRISNSIKLHWKNNYSIKMKGVMKTADKLRGRKVGSHSEEWKKKISNTEKGKIISLDTKFKQRQSRIKFAKEHPEVEKQRGIKTGNKLRGKKQAIKFVEKVRERWKNPQYKEKRLKEMMKFTSPNKPENRLNEIIKNNKLPYTFVGNGRIIIGGFNPDFISDDNKTVVEVFGDYWHNRKDWIERDKKRFETFKYNGYNSISA